MDLNGQQEHYLLSLSSPSPPFIVKRFLKGIENT